MIYPGQNVCVSSKARCPGNKIQYLLRAHWQSWCFVPQLNYAWISLFLGVARLIIGCFPFNQALLLLMRELADSSLLMEKLRLWQLCCNGGGGQRLCAAQKPQALHLKFCFLKNVLFLGWSWTFFFPTIYHLVKGRMLLPPAAVLWPSERKSE